MSQLPGFSRIPPEPLSKEEVTSVLRSGVLFWTNPERAADYILYPYDVSIILTPEDIHCKIHIFGKEYYSVLDLTSPFYIDDNTMYIIIGIDLDKDFTKDIYIDKLILDFRNFNYDARGSFDTPMNVHINVLEITSPMSLFSGNTNFAAIHPSKVIIPNCYIGACTHFFNEEKDSFDHFIDATKQIPVSIKNTHFGKTHYFTEENTTFSIIDPYYIADTFSIKTDSLNTLWILYLSELYLEDDFVAINSNGEKFSIDTVHLDGYCYNISLPSFIKKLDTDSVIYGHLDISRCIDFQLDTLFSDLETEHHIMYHYSTIYVNSNQFTEMQASNLIVRREGEDFYVLSAYADQTERENYVKVVVKSE